MKNNAKKIHLNLEKQFEPILKSLSYFQLKKKQFFLNLISFSVKKSTNRAVEYYAYNSVPCVESINKANVDYLRKNDLKWETIKLRNLFLDYLPWNKNMINNTDYN